MRNTTRTWQSHRMAKPNPLFLYERVSHAVYWKGRIAHLLTQPSAIVATCEEFEMYAFWVSKKGFVWRCAHHCIIINERITFQLTHINTRTFQPRPLLSDLYCVALPPAVSASESVTLPHNRTHAHTSFSTFPVGNRFVRTTLIQHGYHDGTC